MTLQELIQLIGQDLQNEWAHLQFYTHHQATARGMHSAMIQKLFEEEAISEMQHVTEFSKLIAQLGGEPVLHNNGVPGARFSCIRAMLQHAHDMEVTVSQNYLVRIQQAEELGGVDGKLIQLFYEKQLEQSATDAAHYKQLLEDVGEV
jgi:bacterioferritin (cytochrome b1)